MFKLLPETLFLAGNLVDRFLALRPVTRDKLQLIGLTALLISSKFEEIYPPEIQDFVFISGKYKSHWKCLNLTITIRQCL